MSQLMNSSISPASGVLYCSWRSLGISSSGILAPSMAATSAAASVAARARRSPPSWRGCR